MSRLHHSGKLMAFRRWVVTLQGCGRRVQLEVSARGTDEAIGLAKSLAHMPGTRVSATVRLANQPA